MLGSSEDVDVLGVGQVVEGRTHRGVHQREILRDDVEASDTAERAADKLRDRTERSGPHAASAARWKPWKPKWLISEQPICARMNAASPTPQDEPRLYDDAAEVRRSRSYT